MKQVNAAEFVRLLTDPNNDVRMTERLQDEHRSMSGLRRVRVHKSVYGGARMDRIAQRNRFTNALGFPRCEGREFMAVDSIHADGSPYDGTFLANVLADYWQDYKFYVNGDLIDFSHDFTMNGSYLGVKPRAFGDCAQ